MLIYYWKRQVAKMVAQIEEYDELTQDVVHFVSKEIGEKLSHLQPNSRILHDLGVDGDDAFELIIKFCKHYEVDSSDFQYNQYFGSEGVYIKPAFIFFILAFPFLLIYSIIAHKKPTTSGITIDSGNDSGKVSIKKHHKEPMSFEQIPLTIQDLVNSARTKKLHSLATEPE